MKPDAARRITIAAHASCTLGVNASRLAADGASTVYRRLVVPAGRHEIRARLSDNAQGEFNYVAERTVELAAGRVLLIDFNATAGGFVFRM